MYEIWRGIKRRCGLLTYGKDTQKYLKYKGKGITMAPEWAESLETFIKDMGPRPGKEYSVDRIDNSLGYSPGNCRWATHSEQMNNRDVNCYIDFNGDRRTYAEWARELDMPWELFRNRVERLFQGKEAVEPRGQRVIQKDKNSGDVIGEFENVREAAKTSGVSQAAIRKCLCKHNNSAGGYLWGYKS
jgi:hypothetical protein